MASYLMSYLNPLLFGKKSEHHYFLRFSTLCLTLLLFACQSKLDIAGDNHELAFKKWHNLADYASENFSNHSMLMVASLTIEANESAQQYMFTRIKLAKRLSANEINLLRPSFLQTSVCYTLCRPISSLIMGASDDNQTLLYNFFAHHEFKLFKFYAAIAQLNKQLLALNEIDSLEVAIYTSWLVDQNRSFENLIDFTEFLQKALSTERFIEFISDPEQLYAQLLAIPNDETKRWMQSNQENPEELAILSNQESPEELAVLVNQESPEELAMLANQESPEELAMLANQESPEELAMLANQESPEELAMLIEVNSQSYSKGKWLRKRPRAIAIGDTVCSFNNNSFGIVSEIRGSNIAVRMVGKMSILADGLQSIPAPGAIFNAGDDMYFTPLQDLVTFNSDDIAKCQIQ
jgi:hypothetical protein